MPPPALASSFLCCSLPASSILGFLFPKILWDQRPRLSIIFRKGQRTKSAASSPHAVGSDGCHMIRKLNFRYIVFATLAVVLVASLPFALWHTYKTGEIYSLSSRFLEDIPKRLTGPGRFRFLLQPAVAVLLGIRSGIVDARAGNPPFILAFLFYGARRSLLLKHAFSQLSVLIAMSILLDLIAQFLILREVYPGPALVLGPVLIAFPYSIARSLTGWFWRRTAP